jgi:hypothetical protein
MPGAGAVYHIGRELAPLFSRTGNRCSLISVACAGRAEIPIIAMGSTGAVGEHHTRADHHFCESIILGIPYVSFARAPIHSSKGSITMNQRTTLTLTTVALLCLGVAVSGLAQAPQTVRLRGVIEKVDGKTVIAKSDKDDELKINLADKMLVVEVVTASILDIKDGAFIGSGAMPQPDGSQKAIEVHIFAESMRGTGEGFRPWDGAPNSTMTNGTVGTAVTGVNGPVITVKYKDGEKKIIVTPNVPIVRYEIGNMSAVKPGVAFTVIRAVTKPDGSFDIDRINVGRDGVVPR